MSARSEKTPNESQTESRKLVMPDQINSGGTLFGGQMMAWIDKLAAMTAQRHSESHVVTASIDQISFLAPVYQGDHVVMRGRIIYVGRTSMEIRVDVEAVNPIKGTTNKTTQAFLTFVALDGNGKPKTIPSLKLESKEDKEAFEFAKERIEIRKAWAKKSRQS